MIVVALVVLIGSQEYGATEAMRQAARCP